MVGSHRRCEQWYHEADLPMDQVTAFSLTTWWDGKDDLLGCEWCIVFIMSTGQLMDGGIFDVIHSSWKQVLMVQEVCDNIILQGFTK